MTWENSHDLTWKLIKQDTKQCVWSRGVRGKEAFCISLRNFLLDLQIRSLLPENLGYIPEPWLIQIVHSLPPQSWGFRTDEPGSQCLRGGHGLSQIQGQPLACLCPPGWHSGSSLHHFIQLNCGLQTNRTLQGLLWQFTDWVYRTTPSSQNAGSTHKIWRTTIQKWISIKKKKRINKPSQGLVGARGLQRGGSISASHGKMMGIWQWEILK